VSDQPHGLPAEIDAGTAHPARIYDALLGGKDNFPADRRAADQILAAVPTAGAMARANRAFLQRAVRFLTREAGIRQFLDIGTGLPTSGTVHQVAQAITPHARVVYVDNDPVVLAHGRALLAGDRSVIVDGDVRHPDQILRHPDIGQSIDFARPVAVLLLAILHFVTDAQDPVGIVARLRDAMAPGGYLVLSHATADFSPDVATTAARAYERSSAPIVLRSRAEIQRLFQGFELVDPGLVQVAAWRPDEPPAQGQGEVWAYAGVGRKLP
jgi:SAM-dependent methyltransferase